MAFGKLTVIKLLELVLAIVIFALHYHSYEANSFSHLFLMSTVFSGFMLVFLGTFIGLVTGNGIHKTVDMFYSVIGAVLFITAGALSIQHFQGWSFQSKTVDIGLSKGSLAIIEAAFCIIDAFFTYRGDE